MHMSESMKELLDYYSITELERAAHIPARARRFRIWKKTDLSGRPFWAVLNFCGIDTSAVSADRQLGWLEWDGNEIYLGTGFATEIPTLLKRAAGIMKYWKKQLERDYPETPFVIFASYGDNLEFLEDVDDENYYVNMRFFALRNSDTLLDFDGMENNAQPVMWYCCNFR